MPRRELIPFPIEIGNVRFHRGSIRSGPSRKVRGGSSRPFPILDGHPFFPLCIPVFFRFEICIPSESLRGSGFKPLPRSPVHPGVPASIARGGHVSDPSAFLCATSPFLPLPRGGRHRPGPPVASEVPSGFQRRSGSQSNPIRVPNCSLSSPSDELGRRVERSRPHRIHSALRDHASRRESDEDGGRKRASTHHGPMQPPGNQDRRTRKRPGRAVRAENATQERSTWNGGMGRKECDLPCRMAHRKKPRWKTSTYANTRQVKRRSEGRKTAPRRKERLCLSVEANRRNRADSERYAFTEHTSWERTNAPTTKCS